MEGETHRRELSSEELVQGGVLPESALGGDRGALGDFSILLAKQRQMAEFANGGS